MTVWSIAGQIAINLASVLVGSGLTLTWQSWRRRLKNARAAEFLGLNNAKRCSITLDVSPRGTPTQLRGKKVMTHNDAQAAMHIFRMLDRLGGAVDLFDPDSKMPNTEVEFCLGGPRANSRTGRLLETHIKTLSMRDSLSSSENDAQKHPQDIIIEEGSTRFVAKRQNCEYAILARIWRQSSGRGNIFVVAGQTSDGNLPAVQWLEDNIQKLHRELGKQSFYLILRLKDWDDNSERYETVERCQAGIVDSRYIRN